MLVRTVSGDLLQPGFARSALHDGSADLRGMPLPPVIWSYRPLGFRNSLVFQEGVQAGASDGLIV
jgi:hypothetical protein